MHWSSCWSGASFPLLLGGGLLHFLGCSFSSSKKNMRKSALRRRFLPWSSSGMLLLGKQPCWERSTHLNRKLQPSKSQSTFGCCAESRRTGMPLQGEKQDFCIKNEIQVSVRTIMYTPRGWNWGNTDFYRAGLGQTLYLRE